MTAPPTALDPSQLTLSRESAADVHRQLRRGFASGLTRSVVDRVAALKRLREAVGEREKELTAALAADLGKPAFESYTSEIGFIYQDIDHTLAHLAGWAERRSASVGMALWPTRAEVHAAPKGVVLIIAPWNYPVNLSLAPLIAAVAAGCTVALKPAEDTPHASATVERIVHSAFPRDWVRVVQGPGAQVVPTLMAAGRFDHVFYTGSTRVGREIGAQCGEALIPCTLELGGKSPAVVFDDAALESTADRIVWGKCYNAGQTCVAPDYLLVQSGVFERFVELLSRKLRGAYGPDAQTSPDLARIINDKHFERLVGLLDSATVAHGGQHDASDRFIAPTLLVDVELDGELMREEIFGPLLPIIPFDTWEDAKDVMALHPDPLAAYVFTQDEVRAERFIDEVRFGGGCVNDTVVHLGIPDLPFGGVGTSGHGRYHGEAGFRTFTYTKSIARSPGRLNIPTRYAPYRESFLRAVKWLLG